MAAGTTLDKVGPMCRSAEGAAIVLHAVAGPDNRDLSVPGIPVRWDGTMDLGPLRLGHLASAFEAEEDAEYRAEHARVLTILRSPWPDPTAVELPAWSEYVTADEGGSQ
jgi:Asp-tRNA(Asn)/Glu-tRNA(Gln) amidotransferase A subunit family amidase